MDQQKALEISQRLSARREAPRFCPGAWAGRGIVICAGGARMFTSAYVQIHVLRHHLGCQLPIEVWHIGSDELSSRMSALLLELQAHPIDARAVMAVGPAHVTNPWQLKPYAIMQSGFEEVLYLDADQVPVRDPAEVFSWPKYCETGAVLWPDILDLPSNNPIWTLCGLAPRRVVSIESGQMLFHKPRLWQTLDLALAINEEAEHLYQVIYGDKDSYLLAALMCDQPVSIIPFRPKTDLPWCLYQCDFAGAVLFQHRTGAKWLYSGKQQHLPQFSHSEACEAALAVLRRKWNGRVYNPPPIPKNLPAAAFPPLGQSLCLLRPGCDEVRLELLPDGEVATETECQPMNWFLEQGAGTSILVLCSEGAPELRFERSSAGTWRAEGVLLLPTESIAHHACRYVLGELLAAAGYPGAGFLRDRNALQSALALLSRRYSQMRDELRFVRDRAPNTLIAELIDELIQTLPPLEIRSPAAPTSDWKVLEERYTDLNGD